MAASIMATPSTISDAEHVVSREGGDSSSPPKNAEFNPRVGNLTDEKIVDQIKRLKTEGRDRLADIFNVMLSCYDQYRNKADFSAKESWQSRITIAKGHAAVKHATANILKLLTQTAQPITVEDDTPRMVSWAPDVEKVVLKLWQKANYRECMRDTLEGGFACGLGAVKTTWNFDERNRTTLGDENNQPVAINTTMLEGKLRLSSLDPWNITFGPSTKQFGKVDWIIEESVVEIPDLLEMSKVGGQQMFENVDKFIKEDFSADDYRQQIRRRKDEIQPREHIRHTARLWEFMGDLVDEDKQEIVQRDAHILIVNEKYLLKFGTIPYWDKKKGYIIFSPLSVAFRFPGQGILETSRAIKESIDEIAQMQVDKLKFSLLAMFEADMGQLENPEDLATGVEPGKFFRKRPGSAGVQVIRPIEIPGITNDSFNALTAYHNEYQRGTFITDVTQGMLDTKGETTATEIQQVQANTTLMLADIAMHIEDTLLAPLAELTWDRAFQFMDANSNPSWTSVLGGQHGAFLDQLGRAERMSIIQGDYNFTARGLSRVLERKQQLQNLLQFFGVVGQFGPMFIPFINMPDLFRRIFESFHFEEPMRLLSPQAQQVMQQMTKNLLAQQDPNMGPAMDAAKQAIQQHMKNQGALDIGNQQAQNQGDLQNQQSNNQLGGNVVMEIIKSMMAQQQGGTNGGA